MIGKLILSILVVFSGYLTYIHYGNYQVLTTTNITSGTSTSFIPEFDQYDITFKSIWKQQSEQQHQKYTTFKQINFKINNKTKAINLLSGDENNNINITFSFILDFTDIDAAYIQHIYQLQAAKQAANTYNSANTANSGVYLITSKFYDIIYKSQTKNICYQQINSENKEKESISLIDDKIWVFTIPHHNVIILRVYSCSSQSSGQLLYSHKYLPQEKINYMKELTVSSKSSKQPKSTEVQMIFVGFSRDQYHYSFQRQTYQLRNRKKQPASTLKHLSRRVNDFTIQLSNTINQMQISKCIDELIYQSTAGYYGRKYQASYQKTRQNQQLYQIQFLDTHYNLIGKLNSKNQQNTTSNIVSLGEVLVPFRTPVFMSKQQYDNMPTIQSVLQNIKLPKNKQINLKVYQIKDQNILEMNQLLSVHRTLPDSSLSFMGVGEKALHFYPKQNLNSQAYFAVRTSLGAVVFKGSKIQGYYDKTPTPQSSSDIGIKTGQSDHQIYQQITANGIQLIPTIYQAQYIYRSLFASPKKNKVQLINALSGQSVMSHYISIKEGYQLSTMSLLNNQFWVFEHNQNIDLPPLITKYQLFFNSTAHKTILSIKRNYELISAGRIISLQKCLDTFYYFQSVHEDNYVLTRVHQAKLSNRQHRIDGRYAGAFQKSMILNKLQKNVGFLISPLEQQVLTVKLTFGKQMLSQWKKLSMKHQYQILPYRVYYRPSSNSYIFFNIRKILLSSYDLQLPKIRNNIIEKSFYGFLVVTSLLASILIWTFISNKTVTTETKQKSPTKSKAQESRKKSSKKDKKTAVYQSVDYKKQN